MLLRVCTAGLRENIHHDGPYSFAGPCRQQQQAATGTVVHWKYSADAFLLSKPGFKKPAIFSKMGSVDVKNRRFFNWNLEISKK
jgi:hypothetical protein